MSKDPNFWYQIYVGKNDILFNGKEKEMQIGKIPICVNSSFPCTFHPYVECQQITLVCVTI